MIGIINYRMGNIKSVKKALHHIGAESLILSSPDQLDDVDKLILPGVGAFGEAMSTIRELGFLDAILHQVTNKKKPLLGICLGMQLLYEESEELGLHKGLGLIKGSVNHFSNSVSDLPIPHMGWNNLVLEQDSILLKGIEEDENVYYFVHSLHCSTSDRSIVVAKADYGIMFDACIAQENIFGCQFHPEKSQKPGLTILSNFAGAQA